MRQPKLALHGRFKDWIAKIKNRGRRQRRKYSNTREQPRSEYALLRFTVLLVLSGAPTFGYAQTPAASGDPCATAADPRVRLEACQLAVRFNLDNPSARLRLGWALLGADRADEARREFLAAARLGNPGVYGAEPDYGIGVALARLGRQEEAISSLRRAIRIDKSLAAAHHALGASLGALGRQQEAVEAYRSAIRLDSANVDASLGLVQSLNLLGRHDEALEAGRQLIARRPKVAEAQYVFAYTLLTLDRTDEALTHLQEAVRLAPADADLRFELGAAFQRLRRLDQALGSFTVAARLRADHAPTWGALGLTAAQLGRHIDAVSYWARARVLASDYFAGRPDEEALWKKSVESVGPRPPATIPPDLPN